MHLFTFYYTKDGKKNKPLIQKEPFNRAVPDTFVPISSLRFQPVVHTVRMTKPAILGKGIRKQYLGFFVMEYIHRCRRTRRYGMGNILCIQRDIPLNRDLGDCIRSRKDPI